MAAATLRTTGTHTHFVALLECFFQAAGNNVRVRLIMPKRRSLYRNSLGRMRQCEPIERQKMNAFLLCVRVPVCVLRVGRVARRWSVKKRKEKHLVL